MLPLLISPRGRAVAATLVGLVVQAAVQVSFAAWQEWDPLLALAVGIAVAVLAGALGGLLAGTAVGVAGASLFLAYADADNAIAAATFPAWLAAGAIAGLASDLWARTREAKRRDEAELSAVRSAAPVALVGVAADDTIASWGGAAETLYGRPADEAVSADASLLGADVVTLIEEARKSDEPVHALARHVRPDGNSVSTLTRALAHGDPPGAVLVAATDIGEAERLENELRDLRGRHEALRRALPIVAYVHPPGERDNLVYVNGEVERLLGYAPEELCADGGGLGRLVHPEDRDRLGAVLRAGERDGSFRAEYRLLARDGRAVPVRDEAATVRDAAGQPSYVQGFLTDLSDRLEFQREREELALAKREALAEAATKDRRLDFALAAGALLDASSNPASALRRVAELAVRDFADWCAVDVVSDDGGLLRLAAAHANAIESPDERAGAPGWAPGPEARRVVETGEPVVVPDADALKRGDAGSNGARRDSRILAPMVARDHRKGVVTFVRQGLARPYGADDVAVAVDVARRAALAIDVERLYARVEQEADAARVLAYVADGVFLVDRTGVIRLWNPAAEAITGFPAASVVGRLPADVIHGWEAMREDIPVATSTAPAIAHTVALNAADDERWISISGVEFFGGTVYAFRDVTEARRLDELKAEFVATASHELRTPLAAVYGAAQTLRRHDFALDEAGRERFVSMIVEEADRLGRIVNEILLANQLDAGGVVFVHEPFDPRELVERVAEATRSHTPPGISLEVAVRGAAPNVAADRDKARQILLNLVDNAMKYSPNGGTVEIGVEPRAGRVRFYVRDEGLGIPPDEHERIFQKFYRLDPGMTRGVGGTGLGLYICSEIVRRMGGEIWVDSSEGEGSTFSFELPAVEGAPAGAPAAAGDAAARDGQRERP